jgi:uncharacterized cupredoxin-like copper-binding protein
MHRSSLTRWGTLGVLALAAACAKKQPPPRQAMQAGPNHVVVVAQDYTFTAPDSIPAGLEMFHLVNKGPSLHHLQLVQLDSGKTVRDLIDAMKKPGPPPAWARFVGGPNAVAPTGTDTAVAYLTLAPGSYAMLCLIPDDKGMPHFMHGMFRALTVTATGDTPAPPPTPDIVIHLKDYQFDVTGALTAGPHTIRVVNDGPQMHEMLLAMLAPHKTAADLVNFVEKNHMRGMPPARPMGGATALAPGASEEITVTLTPGNYGLFCFLPGPDGKDHVLHGMVKALKVS